MNTTNQHTSKGFSWGIGAATLMCIFTVMFLTVFSVLSFMTSESEVKNSEKFSQSITDYYASDSAASDFYGRVLNILRNSGDINEALEEIRNLDFTNLDAFTTELSGDIGLIISVRTNVENSTGRNIDLEFFIDWETLEIKVTKWKAFSASELEWEADESLELWIPDF